MKKLLMLVLVLVSITAIAFATPLNLTFEDNSDVTNWGNHDESTQYTICTQSSTGGVLNSGALHFTDTGWGFLTKRPLVAESGKAYSLTFYVKTDAWTHATNTLKAYVTGLSTVEPEAIVSTISDYTLVTLSGTADAGTSGYIRFYGMNTGEPSSLWIDNLEFTDGAEPAPTPTNVSVLDLRDNESYFEITDNGADDLDLGTDYTIEAWIYIRDAAHGNERIFRSYGWQMYVVSGTGESGANATVRADGSFLTGGGSINLSIPTEEWHHIALQGNSAGGWTNNYIDGAAIGNGGASNITGSANLRIGSYSTVGSGFDGVIDEVRISDINRYGRLSFSVNKNDPLFISDANTILLCHFDDDALPPTNSSSKVFTTTNYGITTNEYIAYNDASLSGAELALPITLSSFTAQAVNGSVELAWETATETNNARFVVYRDGEAIGSIDGAGTTTEPHNYSFVDNTVVPGVIYTYVLADVNLANEETLYSGSAVMVTANDALVANGYIVGAAYPNPFNPSTIVPLELTKNAMVSASLYDMNGREIKGLMNASLSAGTHNIHVDGSDLTTGMYLVQIHIDDAVIVQKISLMK